MTSETCQRWRSALGLFVLGQLPPAEQAGLTAHLDGCPDCRREAAELGAAARALELVGPEPGSGAPVPPPGLGERVVESVRAEHRRGRRRAWRLRAGVGGAAAAGVVAGTFATLAVVGDEPARPEGRQVAFSNGPAGVEATATVADRDWGSGIWLEASGLRAGEVYATWLERPDGSRISAGTFRPAPDGAIRCYLTAGISRRQAVAVGVSDEAGRVVLVARLS